MQTGNIKNRKYPKKKFGEINVLENIPFLQYLLIVFVVGPPCVDLLASLPGAGCWGLADHHSPLSDDVDAYDVVSLPVLLKRSVTAPLMAQ